MTTPPSGGAFADVSGLVARFAELRARGEAADGMVSVTLDGTGGITDLVIAPKAMRLAAEDLALAIREAFDAARAGVQAELQAAPPPSAVPADLKATLEEMGFQAQRRLDEILSLASDVAARTRPGAR
ncbi:MAG: YbaB/EbfC family nucleoid-associated protein [Jatrophihabitans sp.]|uniref:YbaB/EbfC family nucleoid-associated protein n=1 Tax=Jatrophihabitans sp. TaxID=1932789 RepID=UPI003F804FEB